MLKVFTLFLLILCLILTGCGASKKKIGPPFAAPAAGQEKAESSAIRRRIISLANREWEFFGRQVVVLEGGEESIPHVGMWEDDEETYSIRVNWYWRAVGKSELTGDNCRQPWSAAFISWIMKNAGVSDYEFPRTDTHWVYLNRIANGGDRSHASFVPHSIGLYVPKPGDLICATRGRRNPPPQGQTYEDGLSHHTKLHCDIVVSRQGETLEAIGGNVRNSVSKTILRLDKNGLLQPTPRRPWFLVLENRL